MAHEGVTRGSHVGGTLIALVIAPICFVISGGILGVIYGLLQRIFTDSSAWWTMTTVGIVQAVSGTYAARLACDSVLRGYSKRSVFVEFIVIVGALTAASLIILPFSGKQVATIIEFCVLCVVAWPIFWKGEPLDGF